MPQRNGDVAVSKGADERGAPQLKGGVRDRAGN
jgi:hypothetical protein